MTNTRLSTYSRYAHCFLPRTSHPCASLPMSVSSGIWDSPTKLQNDTRLHETVDITPGGQTAPRKKYDCNGKHKNEDCTFRMYPFMHTLGSMLGHHQSAVIHIYIPSCWDQQLDPSRRCLHLTANARMGNHNAARSGVGCWMGTL